MNQQPFMKAPLYTTMKRMFGYSLAGWLTLGALSALAQVPATGTSAGAQPSPQERAAKVKERWSTTLSAAVREFQHNNDQESANFLAGILASLDRPDGLSADALTANLARMKERVQQLVLRSAMESAASLNHAQVQVSYEPNFGQPPHPVHKTGGAPGPEGLVLYFSFDRPDENGRVHDDSGAGNDGQVSGAKWIPAGKFGGAYHFSLTNFTDQILVPNSDLLNPEAITIAAWVKTADKDGFWNRILDKDCWHGYGLSLGGDWKGGKSKRGTLQVETGRGFIGSDRVLDDGQWHHIAASYDGRTLRFYIDAVGKSRPSNKPGPLQRTSWDLCIGNSAVNYGTGELLAFDGDIDELRIYNRALSAEEVKALAKASAAAINLATPASTSAAPKASPAERLKQLKDLYEQGLISKDDYDKKVKEIMDSL